MKYQFCIRFNSIDVNSAASKAVVDCSKIFSDNGYRDYTFTVASNKNKIRYYCLLFIELVKFFVSIKPRSIVGIQYPLLSINHFFKYFIKVAKIKKISFFCIIHDLESLRSGGHNSEAIAKEITNLNAYNTVIAHNEQMKAWLRQNGLSKPIIALDLFDYIVEDIQEKESTSTGEIVFAGNLLKSEFVYNLSVINQNFNLYGPNYQTSKPKAMNVKWRGEFSPTDIVTAIAGSYGLIWDGNELDKLDSLLGNYLKYNNPHKCSLYIAAGLPVIVPKSAAIGKLVKKLNIGFTIDDLYALNSMEVSEDSYQLMKKNVSRLRRQIIEGTHFSRAIWEVEEYFDVK